MKNAMALRPKKVAVVFGTRPEAIKLAPVIKELERPGSALAPVVIVTAQHRQMLDQVLDVFGIVPDIDLDLMRPRQNLSDITANALPALERAFQEASPDLVLVQGDTTTTFVASLAACYTGIPVAHVEAGLRTFDKRRPFPEEVNRQLITVLADLHLAPTASAKTNLLREGVSESTVYVTGNTVIDALQWVLHKTPDQAMTASAAGCRQILVTAHRRENWGEGIENICRALVMLSERHHDVNIVFSCHLNPVVRDTVDKLLSGRPRVTILEPLDYVPFVHLMANSHIILTDSGGIQEEAPSLGVPVLVMRDVTERPEGVEAGTVRVVGTGAANIASQACLLLEDDTEYKLMAQAINPYGDGQAARRIVDALVAKSLDSQVGCIK